MSKQSKRFNKGKLRWALIDWDSEKELLKVLDKYADIYGPRNWKKGLNREEILESAQRHLIALFNNEHTDPESKLAHAAHIKANMMFYLFHHKHNSFSKKRNNPFKIN